MDTEDPEYWRFCLRKWLVALVAGAINPDVVNQTVLIFQGGQGIGKSTFLLGLAPPSLSQYVYSGNLNPNDKDSILQLSETILCNLDELDSLNKYKESALKELITKSEIRVRRPYGRFAEKLTRHASLCGSVNDSSVLSDTTGSRRFLIHKVTGITYDHGIDMDKVYAQAYHLYKEGFQYWFDTAEIQRIHQKNKAFEIQSVEEELLLEYYQKPGPDETDKQELTSTQILEEIQGQKPNSQSHAAKIRLGQALSKHGFSRRRIDGVTK